MASDLECDHAMMHRTQEFCPGCFASRNKIEVLRARAGAQWERAEGHDVRRDIVADSWRCTKCRTLVMVPAGETHPDRCEWCEQQARHPPVRMMIHAQARSTVVLLDDDQDGQRLSINGHYLEDARAVRIEKAGDRICVSFQLETEPKQ